MRYKRTLPNFQRLVTLLNDLQFHSGVALASELNVTRNAIWKMVKQMQNNQIMVEAEKNRGYKFKQPLFLYERNKIIPKLPQKIRDKIQLEIYSQLPSTNTYFFENKDRDYSKPVFCLAELQTAGKGRLGRAWHSPFAQNIYCSCRWDLPCDVSKLAGLSLVVGLAVVSALNQLNTEVDFKLKWPNDIIANNKKLGGVLVDVIAEAHGACSVIIGLGLNINMQCDAEQITQQWTSMQLLLGKNFDRNQIVALYIPILLDYLQRFVDGGFAEFISLWKKYDYLREKTINVTHQKRKLKGVMLGVDQQGQLRLQQADKSIISCVAGEATLR